MRGLQNDCGDAHAVLQPGALERRLPVSRARGNVSARVHAQLRARLANLSSAILADPQ